MKYETEPYDILVSEHLNVESSPHDLRITNELRCNERASSTLNKPNQNRHVYFQITICTYFGIAHVTATKFGIWYNIVNCTRRK